MDTFFKMSNFDSEPFCLMRRNQIWVFKLRFKRAVFRVYKSNNLHNCHFEKKIGIKFQIFFMHDLKCKIPFSCIMFQNSCNVLECFICLILNKKFMLLKLANVFRVSLNIRLFKKFYIQCFKESYTFSVFTWPLD